MSTLVDAPLLRSPCRLFPSFPPFFPLLRPALSWRAAEPPSFDRTTYTVRPPRFLFPFLFPTLFPTRVQRREPYWRGLNRPQKNCPYSSKAIFLLISPPFGFRNFFRSFVGQFLCASEDAMVALPAAQAETRLLPFFSLCD